MERPSLASAARRPSPSKAPPCRPSPSSISLTCRGLDARRRAAATRSISRGMSRRSATAASGWRSTTTWSASPAPPPRSSSAMSPAAPRTIRVGAGGIMLPNHAPLVIAEQFGTLASLYPGRIDLGLGRAPGTDQLTLRALRRDPHGGRHVPAGRAGAAGAARRRCSRARRVQAVPGDGHERPALDPRLEPVRRAARRRCSACPTPSPRISRPTRCCRRCRSIASASSPPRSSSGPTPWSAVNVIAAETDAEARRLFTSPQQSFANLLRGARGRLRPPIDDIEAYWTPAEKAQASRMLACSFVGSAETVRARPGGVRRGDREPTR